jgi:hypothetical protein
MAITDLYNKTASIYTTSTTENEIGEEKKSVTLLASVPCRINRIKGMAQIFASADSTKVDVRIYMDVRTDFEEWDYIEVDSIRYKVANAPVICDYGSNHHMEVDCYINKRP